MFEDGVVIEYSIPRNEAIVEALSSSGGLFSVPLDELIAAISSTAKRHTDDSKKKRKEDVNQQGARLHEMKEPAEKTTAATQAQHKHHSREAKPTKSLPVKAVGRCLTFKTVCSDNDKSDKEEDELEIDDRPLVDLLLEVKATEARATQKKMRERSGRAQNDAPPGKRAAKWRYPLVTIVMMHDSFEMTSKSMFTGTLREVRGRFAIISSPFLQFDAMAPTDAMWISSTATAGNLLSNVAYQQKSGSSTTDQSSLESGQQVTVEDLVRHDPSALKLLLRCPVSFSLRMGTFMAQEGFVLVDAGTLCEVLRRCRLRVKRTVSEECAREVKVQSTDAPDMNSDMNIAESGGGATEQEAVPSESSIPNVESSTGNLASVPQRTESEKAPTEILVKVERESDRSPLTELPALVASSEDFPLANVPPSPSGALHRSNVGSWSATGASAVEDFFQPQLTVKLTYDNVKLQNNTPPLMGAADSFSIQLLCLCMPSDCELSLRATLDNQIHTDVSADFLDVQPRMSSDIGESTVRVDRLTLFPVAAFDATWKSACVPEEFGYREVRLRLQAKLGEKELNLISKPILLRSAMYKEQYRRHLELDVTSIAHKYWISDALGPGDSTLDGFLDPGRSNFLFRTRSAYAALPSVEREVIVIDEHDDRLRAVASSAQATLQGIFDTRSKVQALMWLVTSYYGGEMQGDEADLDAPLLRPTKKTRKRRREEEELNSTVVLLGDVQHGLCRHRALLFKYLCDYSNIPCYLVRGEHRGPDDEEAERHSWNVVPVAGSEVILVDTTLSPNALLAWPDPAYIGPKIDSSKLWDDGCSITIRAPAEELHLLEECGCGAFSVVRRATYGGFTCAVKLPRKPAYKSLLLHEYQILQSLAGAPCVVQSFGWSKGIIMEFFPTSVLGLMNTLILRQQRLSYAQQKSVLRGVLTALRELHARHLVHRDVKSENVLAVIIRCSMCRSMGVVCQVCDIRVKLVDFADCASVSSGDGVVLSSHRVGTPPYAAPEIERELTFSYAADLWSVGVLAVEMATMKLPSAEQLLASSSSSGSSLQDDPRREVPHAVLGDTKRPPQWLQTLVRHTLVEDWTKRKSAAELLELLK